MCRRAHDPTEPSALSRWDPRYRPCCEECGEPMRYPEWDESRLCRACRAEVDDEEADAECVLFEEYD